MTNRMFGYNVHNGKAYPVKILNMPTDGQGKITLNLEQSRELSDDEKNLNLQQLSSKYPYKEFTQ